MTSRCSRPRNPQRKPNPSASEALGFVEQGRVVQGQLRERLAQALEVVGVDREHAGVDLRFHPGETRQGLDVRAARVHERVADRSAPDRLDAGHDIADLAGRQRGAGLAFRREVPDLVDHVDLADGVGNDPVALSSPGPPPPAPATRPPGSCRTTSRRSTPARGRRGRRSGAGSPPRASRAGRPRRRRSWRKRAWRRPRRCR